MTVSYKPEFKTALTVRTHSLLDIDPKIQYVVLNEHQNIATIYTGQESKKVVEQN